MQGYRSALGFAAAFALLLASAGCGGGERYQTEEQADKVEAPLAPASHFQLPDVPVPADLRYDRGNSFISEDRSERSASLLYNGRLHVERVANFFRDHMQAAPGWKLQKSRSAGSRYIMIFTKGQRPERCRISIERRSMGKVRVIVDVD